MRHTAMTNYNYRTNKIVRVTTQGFELEDGRVYSHPIPLEEDELPTIEEFQEYYDHWFNVLGDFRERETIDDCSNL
jgi:hypothetical protein